MKLTRCIHRFFNQYLPRLKGVSDNTITTYRYAFSLFLPFAAQYHHLEIEALEIEHLSSDLILAFLDYLQTRRKNTPQTRNLRLAALKSLTRMMRLFYPETKQIADKILGIPKKRTPKPLIEYLTTKEIFKLFEAVDLKKKDGFRDYTILHLLVDSGARASEIARLDTDYYDQQNRSLSILGKGSRFRRIALAPKTAQLIDQYIDKYRGTPRPQYRPRLFINQRGGELTRHGVYGLCRKYLRKALPEKRLKGINPVHSLRHSCAVNMLCAGKDITEVKNRLGHEKLETTMIYLKLELSRKRTIQKEFITYTQSVITSDPKIDELIDWEKEAETLAWLDSL